MLKNGASPTKGTKEPAAGSDDNTVKLWDPASGKLLHTLEGILRDLLTGLLHQLCVGRSQAGVLGGAKPYYRFTEGWYHGGV